VKLKLLKRENLVKSSPDGDPIDYYYYPFIGYVYKKRLSNTLKILDAGRVGRLLDIGFGCGIAFPELAARTGELFGLEIHQKIDEVRNSLIKEGIAPELVWGSVLKIPFADNFFDTVVSISTLEHIEDLSRAFAEIKRVLRPGGRAVLSFPVRNKITDWFYRLFGYAPREIHPSSHRQIIKKGLEILKLIKIKKFPSFLPLDYSLYVSVEFNKQ